MHKIRVRPLAGGLAVTALASSVTLVATASGAHAAPPIPSLRVVTGVSHVVLDRFGKEPQLYLNDIAYVAATNGTFELEASRSAGGVRVDQVRRSGGRFVVVRHVRTDGAASMSQGLPKFFRLTLRNSAGHLIKQESVWFCPTAGFDAQRIAARSAPSPTFPQFCGSRLTRVMPWGVNAGWADGVSTGLTVAAKAAPDGIYTLRVAIAPLYARELGVPAKDAGVTLTVRLLTDNGGPCTAICPVDAAPRPQGSFTGAAGNVPVPGNPSQLLPDLEALPAHNLQMQNNKKSGTSYLGFGATIWNRGPGTFDVEGFRQGHHPKMLARQYIDRPGRLPRSTVIGHFEFDTRQGHHHWHLEDVARYSLLSSNGTNIVRSQKQSFCLAPTDAVNLMRPGSMWNPSTIGLESSCPTDEGLWLRETLPVGWGDTYYQSVAGQAFNVTGLANGTYYLQVRANPFGNIHEVTDANNTSYLEIRLGGTTGARTVTVVKPVKKP